MTKIDETELARWIDDWGETSGDDIHASDDDAYIANRIMEHHTGGEYPDGTDWNAAWESLRTMVRPALERVDGFMPHGSEYVAHAVRALDAGVDPDTGEELERDEAPAEPYRASFRIRAIAGADPQDGPSLDRVIQAADDDYRRDVIAGGDDARSQWRSAAAYEWRKLMLEPHDKPTEPVHDGSALAVIAVSMMYAPDATRAMIARDMLAADLPTMRDLRGLANTPEKDVPVDTLIPDLMDSWPDATPDRDTLLDRDHAAWRILCPIVENAPAPVEGHVCGLLSMVDHFEYSGAVAASHAERALRFDPSDRFAAASLDAESVPDPSCGLTDRMDLANGTGATR